METNKEDVRTTHLQLRIHEDIKEDLKITAKLKGLSLSAMILSLIVKAIREEKENSPHAFPDFIQNRPKIVDESDFDKMMIEAFDGNPPPPEELKAIMKAVKEIMKVREVSADGEK